MQKLKYINSYEKKEILGLLSLIVLVFFNWYFYIFKIQIYLMENYLLFYCFFYLLGFHYLIFDVIPVFCYLKYFEKYNLVEFLKLSLSVSIIKKSIKYTIIVIIIILIKQLILQYFILDYIKFTPFFPILKLNNIIFGPFTEEILFRGTILQKINQYMSFKKANSITALLFTLDHFPSWIINDYWILGSSILVFCGGLIFGWIFNKTGSLWPSIIIHSFYNFAANSFKLLEASNS